MYVQNALLSLVWPVYLAYKVVGALPWRWFLLFNVSSLLISQLLVDFWGGFCAEGYSPTSLGGYNDLPRIVSSFLCFGWFCWPCRLWFGLVFGKKSKGSV